MQLHAGPFTMRYEHGFLRRICYGNREVLRMVYFALRDENWGTYALRIADERIESGPHSFSCQYRARHPGPQGDLFEWQVQIQGRADGSIAFEIAGQALADLWKNRAGFCVLHPIRGMGGVPVEIRHADGSQTRSEFPEFIAPQNPFLDIRSLRWHLEDAWYSIDFEGDVFETEDQRNWTDASYKTFCTPLALPFPVQLKQGERVAQRILFRPETELTERHAPAEDYLVRIAAEETYESHLPLPRVGIGPSSEALSPFAADLLRELRLSHYRIEVAPDKTGAEAYWHVAAAQAEALRLPLELVLLLKPPYPESFRRFLTLFQKRPVPLSHVLLLDPGAMATPQPLIGHLADIKAQLGGVKTGVGTHYNFTELNRNRFDPGAADFVSFSLHPQEHASDDASLFENLEAQVDVVHSARHIYGAALPVHVSPITLRKRFNPYAKDPAQFAVPPSQQADPRQAGDFCAAWTLGSLRQLALAGAASATYFTPQGLVGAEGPFPVYEALRRALASS